MREEFERLSTNLLGVHALSAKQLMERAMIAFKEAPASHMSAVRKLTSLDKADPSGIPVHVEFARRERFREDGTGVRGRRQHRVVPCAPRQSAANPPSPGAWECESEERADARTIDWRPAWKTYVVAASALISAVFGDTSSETCREIATMAKDQRESGCSSRCMFGADDATL